MPGWLPRPQAGIEILSRDKAVELVHKFRDIEALTAIKNNICELLQSITRQQIELQENVRLLIESSERYKTLNPFMPFELPDCPWFPSGGAEPFPPPGFGTTPVPPSSALSVGGDHPLPWAQHRTAGRGYPGLYRR